MLRSWFFHRSRCVRRFYHTVIQRLLFFAEEKECTEYVLYSVIIHKGNAHRGHYHAYIRDVDGLGHSDIPVKNRAMLGKLRPADMFCAVFLAKYHYPKLIESCCLMFEACFIYKCASLWQQQHSPYLPTLSYPLWYKKTSVRLTSVFSTTYCCESLFSVMKFAKSKHRATLTNKHLG